ncbi:DUF1501 domain-containing protein [Rubrivirga sp.]|uniref:DUF1501 domain-containing protein n=1 Tax=Rubrivirga sp. TaxID=1885344 RepID=UPI003C74F411
MSGLGLGVAGAALWGGATPARAFTGSSLLSALRSSETDRVLVLVQLAGGNDGLNTIVPVRNDVYYNSRPRLALRAPDTFSLTDDLGMNRAMASLESAWGDGDVAVVQSVGYDDHSLSHFRSTDIWFSASDSDETLDTGWMGRLMPSLYPSFIEEPPSAPPAIQIGVSAPLLFQGPDAGYAMSVFDVDMFLDLVDSQSPYDVSAVPDTVAGDELSYLRTVANDAFRYRDAIGDAAETTTNGATYPDTGFGNTMGAVARLIKGRLDTRVFLVSLGGFDTHADQSDQHSYLLTQLSDTLRSFYDDLGLTGDAERVLTLTFSEFGRRIEENGSAGTDHGASAPLFLVGPAVEGGLYGEAPDLEAPDDAGNLRHHTDFRSVYATVLERWLDLEAADVEAALGRAFPLLDVLPGRSSVSTGSESSSRTALHPPVPNPMQTRGRIAFDLESAGRVRLAMYDVQGRQVAVLEDGTRPAGQHVVDLEAGSLPAGSYIVRLEAGGQSRTVQATVIR